ncbi:cytochrome c oxidase subunit 5A, mitochondrial-like [Rhagoletis pomonella]|uniref:cytochrome c oxidase subunit 5A, mitochondrial-like n=1 Tax=Rhagoletis pomonella TaxID=28610 RepID=UPI00177E3AD7|nr:cytochrome c oxidase subunit 5A, mitochondrial-like [Rhagoletis pomonella]
MLRVASGQVANVLRGAMGLSGRMANVGSVRASHGEENEDVFNKRYEDYFNRKDIDGWEVRKGMNDLLGMDLVPEPKIIEAGLRACRRVNDISLAIRWLEGCKDKCGDQKATIYPYLIQNIRPTLEELGVPTPEELNYDKPELALQSVYDM